MAPKPEPIFWLNDARGIYIPRDFARSFVNRAKHVSGVTGQQWDILEDGPDNPLYWDVWDEILNAAVVVSEGNVRYRLNQDSDLWLIPEGMEWSDEQDTFVWPECSEEEE
jgi:hypothetical protein